MGVYGPIFNLFKDFLTNRQQRVLVDENFSQFKSVVSGVPQGCAICSKISSFKNIKVSNDVMVLIISLSI